MSREIGAGLARLLGLPELRDLTVSTITGDVRAVTTHVAKWVRGLNLDDGSMPLGIRFPSKRGTNLENWAIWLRAVDDGKPVESEPTTELKRPRPIQRNDPDLLSVARLYGLRIF